MRLGIDRDLDGVLDRDELDAGTNPADRQLFPQVLAPSSEVAAGTSLPLTAQLPPLLAPLQGIIWRKDGQTIAGTTNTSFVLSNVAFTAAGNYSVVVTTPFQPYTSPPVRITVVPLTVAVTPVSPAVRLGTSLRLTATTTGLSPFQYQWEFNGKTLPDETATFLLLSNAQLAQEGYYQVVVANAFGAVTSAPVHLTILINPSVVIPALSQRVVAGGQATFSLMVAGHPPPFGYLLRKSSDILTNYTSDEPIGFLTLSNVQLSNAGTYRIVVTNAANPSPGLTLDPVSLTVIADTDRDGLPDEWETAHALGLNDPSDAQLDPDHDGQTNQQEYLAGTDPHSPASLLKVERVFLISQATAAVVQFNALSNKTYSVQARSSLITGTWSKVADLVALPTNRTVSLTNALEGADARYYRLVTPRVP
jgi:hypothetical protein